MPRRPVLFSFQGARCALCSHTSVPTYELTMKATCDDLVPFIDAYVDAEIDGPELSEFEVHVHECAECRQKVEVQLQFKRQLKGALSSQKKAPDALRTNIMDMIEQEQHVSQRNVRRFSRSGMILAPAAVALVASALAFPSLMSVAPAAAERAPIATQTIEWHKGNLPLEVTGDAKTVTSWFNGKVDFPVRLPKLAHKDATLLGARLAHIQNRRAAYVLYDIKGTRMSVLMFDGKGIKVPVDKVKRIAGHDVAMMNNNGYEVAVLQNDGVTYSMASELPRGEFTKMMKASLTH